MGDQRTPLDHLWEAKIKGRGCADRSANIQVRVTPVQTTSERRRTGAGTVLLAIFLGLLIGVGALTIFIREATYGIWDKMAMKVTGRSLTIDTAQPTIVDKIQRLARLESVTYSMDKMVEGDRTSSILPDFLVGDKLLLNVHGQAIAGIDLSQLKPSDVVVHGKSVYVHLPPAQIFVTALDDSKTRVFSRATGFFVQADPNLESEVRAKAEEQLRESAQSAGILDTARKNAASTVSKLLLSLGFEQVQVD
jgi:hypothetical protein